MSKQYKAINPVKYYKDFLAQGIRPDGRTFTKFRNMAINVDTIPTAEGSAIVKLGNTTVVCGIKAELCAPKGDEPDRGFLIANVDLSPVCSPVFRPGPPSEQAQVYSRLVLNIIQDAGCINLRDLCIHQDLLVWVLYCDIICLDYDGSIVDAAVTALVSALKTVKLPEVNYDADVGEILSVDNDKKIPLKVHKIPVAITYVMFEEGQVMADPTYEEENLSSGNATIVIVDNHVSSVHKPGGTPISNEKLEKCIVETKAQCKYVIGLIKCAFEGS